MACLQPHINSLPSERLQECEQVRLRLPRLGARGFDSSLFPEGLHCVALHLQVRGEIPSGRGDAGVAEIVAYHRHIGA